MKTINVERVRKRIQKMVNEGMVTVIGEVLVYHSKSGAYGVGTEDDLVSAWNLISAHMNRDERSATPK